MDNTIYMEVLLVIHSVRINGDHLQRGAGVTASFKPTQRRRTLVTDAQRHSPVTTDVGKEEYNDKVGSRWSC